MSYLTVVSHKVEAYSSDGRIIPCDYMKHGRFSLKCEFSAGLHYLFIRFAEERTYSKGYELRTAIKLFLDYAIEYELQNPGVLHLNNLSQISPEVFYGYDSFLKRRRGPKDLATRLKTALKLVGQNYDEGMPILSLPLLGPSESKVHEPLTDNCFTELSTALRSHIDYLYEKLRFRGVVDVADPYTFEEVNSVIRTPHAWVPDKARSLKTLLVNNHPFVAPNDEYTTLFRRAQTPCNRPDPVNVVELIYMRYHNPAIRRLTKKAQKLIDLADLLELFYPSALDQSAIVMFLQLQTGWNKETVMGIDGEDFEHVLSEALSSAQTLIRSEKQKSQSTHKPYLSPKMFLAPSSREDKYSAYNLIKLAKALSAPLTNLPVECESERATRGQNPLFMAMRSLHEMSATTTAKGTRPGRFISVTYKNAWERGVLEFFKKYEVREHGKRLSKIGELSGRLRPTWIRYMRDKSNRPLSIVALQQGHKSIETTDIYYDSSGPAMQLRRQRLGLELGVVAELLRERKFKGLIGKRRSTSREYASFRIFTIPGHERSLWACMDSFKPDWPGSATEIPAGEKCSEIPRCLFCSRVCVFEDSLPFLMHRQGTIQDQLENIQESAFDAPLSDELKIIEYILDEWGDERALKDAARYLRKHPDLLPVEMQLLSALVED